MKLIIQIPAFNEEATIGRTLADLPKKVEGISSIETLLIDDGSTDGTVVAARKAGVTHVVRLLSNRGLSTAFIAGVDAALRLGADIIVNTDADNQYNGAEIQKLVAPIVHGSAEVVIGDRQTARSPHMSGGKRFLQRWGSWAVSRASGVAVPDATSGFRAFSREAAYQINVFNPFTYTLETIIQAGNRNLGIQSVPVATNAPTRPSRLYRGMGSYLRKSFVTIFRVYTLYKPLKTFFFLGGISVLLGTAIGVRFLYHFFNERSTGHIQSLILAAIFLLAGFQTLLIGLIADLISVNRRLSEEILIRTKKMDRSALPVARPARPARSEEQRPAVGGPRRHHRSERAQSHAPVAAEPLGTQWVWLVDEKKIDAPAGASETPRASPPRPPQAAGMGVAPGAGRRRRRRRPAGAPRPTGAPNPTPESNDE
ncbi:MAG TPA: glycosyltransferase family 2 protein [Thermoanaerobaculia bacterium]|nr:glycosyltransferase family 2 protein [Thermoanaerobaculia bacterium]